MKLVIAEKSSVSVTIANDWWFYRIFQILFWPLCRRKSCRALYDWPWWWLEREFSYLEEQVALSEENFLQVEVKEKIEPKFNIGDQVRYKDKEFTITDFDELSGGLKTVTITNCSAYGDKTKDLENLKRGDFVKIFGQVKTSIDNNGKEHKNVRILSSKLLKAKEQF